MSSNLSAFGAGFYIFLGIFVFILILGNIYILRKTLEKIKESPDLNRKYRKELFDAGVLLNEGIFLSFGLGLYFALIVLNPWEGTGNNQYTIVEIFAGSILGFYCLYAILCARSIPSRSVILRYILISFLALAFSFVWAAFLLIFVNATTLPPLPGISYPISPMSILPIFILLVGGIDLFAFGYIFLIIMMLPIAGLILTIGLRIVLRVFVWFVKKIRQKIMKKSEELN